jgi:hypothetical protein
MGACYLTSLAKRTVFLVYLWPLPFLAWVNGMGMNDGCMLLRFMGALTLFFLAPNLVMDCFFWEGAILIGLSPSFLEHWALPNF